MLTYTAYEIEKICQDSNIAAIDVVKGYLVLKSGAKHSLPTGKVLSLERNQYNHIVNAWIKYPDCSRLHYWKDKNGVRGARALSRKPRVRKPRGLVLPLNFLGISTDGERVTLADSVGDWMRDIRRVGNHSATVYRLLAAWLHDQRPVDARYLKIRSQSAAFELAQRIGISLTPVTYRQKLIGFEYARIKKPSKEPVKAEPVVTELALRYGSADIDPCA